MIPSPLRERIAGALRLEPMTAPEIARVLCASRRAVADELVIMQARGDVREISNGCWINARRPISRLAA